MAALTGMMAPDGMDLAVTANAPSHGPEPPFLRGLLRRAIKWDALKHDGESMGDRLALFQCLGE